jgi:cardiolipin synthase
MTGRDSRIVTVPNAISLGRLLCVPIFLWLLGEGEQIAAGVLLAVLGASDWVDGWIARRFDQGSELGKILDPVADRVLLITAGIALLIEGSVPVPVGVIVLAREAAISIAVLVLAAKGARRIDVQWSGKAGTLALMFAFPMFLLADASSGTVHDVAVVGAWIFTVSGIAFSYFAALAYIPLARQALREGRTGRETTSGVAAGSVTR